MSVGLHLEDCAVHEGREMCEEEPRIRVARRRRVRGLASWP